MTEYIELQTPVGRLLQGHPLDVVTTNMNNRPLTDKQGNPRIEYFFRIAIAKTDPGLNAVVQQAQAVAAQAFPGGQSQLEHFSWKIIDGDLPAYKDKEGFPGHIIFRCTNGYPITCFSKGGRSIITEKEHIKRGYYIRAIISFKGNGETEKPGIYINCRAVEMFAYGEEIISGPSGEQLFGQGPAHIPAGIPETPVAGSAGMPGFAGVPGATSVPGATQVPAVGTPATGNFLNPSSPPAPGNPPIKTMTEKASNITYDAFIKEGWTDAQLIAHGYMRTDDIPF
ncbi:MAG: DUF2815 family protein [candidate division Zixibacteria bacterium]|nr:DUF2815 family protein [candidate division Zixibacteria bacterium]